MSYFSKVNMMLEEVIFICNKTEMFCTVGYKLNRFVHVPSHSLQKACRCTSRVSRMCSSRIPKYGKTFLFTVVLFKSSISVSTVKILNIFGGTDAT